MIEKLKCFEEERGTLIPIEFNSIEFEVKRIFIVNDVPIGEVRGNHAHYTTKQLIICTNGNVDVFLHNGKEENKYNLNKGDTILIPELVWDSQKFNTKNTEIIVLCSTNFNINDYIFDFENFKKIANNK